MQYDIRDASDLTGLPVVDFLPLGNLGIADLGENAGLRIYPNPVKGKDLDVQSENGVELVEVHNLTGQVLRIYRLTGEKHCKVDLSGLIAGYYYCIHQGYRRTLRVR